MHADTEQQESQDMIKKIVWAVGFALATLLVPAIVFFLFPPLWSLGEEITKGSYPEWKKSIYVLLVSGTFLVTVWFTGRKILILLGYDKFKRREQSQEGSGGVGKYSGRAGKLLGGLIGIAVLFVLVALSGWAFNGCHNEMNRKGVTHGGLVSQNEERAILRQEIARVVQAAQPSEFIATNQYGLRLVRTFTVFSARIGETNTVVNTSPNDIRWGTWTPENLLVFCNGMPNDSRSISTNRTLVGTYTFTAKKDTVEYWVAVGLP